MLEDQGTGAKIGQRDSKEEEAALETGSKELAAPQEYKPREKLRSRKAGIPSPQSPMGPRLRR